MIHPLAYYATLLLSSTWSFFCFISISNSLPLLFLFLKVLLRHLFPAAVSYIVNGTSSREDRYINNSDRFHMCSVILRSAFKWAEWRLSQTHPCDLIIDIIPIVGAAYDETVAQYNCTCTPCGVVVCCLLLMTMFLPWLIMLLREKVKTGETEEEKEVERERGNA